VAGEAWSEPRFERIGMGRRRRQQNERGDGAERECYLTTKRAKDTKVSETFDDQLRAVRILL